MSGTDGTILNGVPISPEPPQQPEPPQKQVNRPKRILLGLGCFVIAAVFGYFFMLQPLVQSHKTGVIHYYVKAIILPPLFTFIGLCLVLTNWQDSDIRKPNAKGKPTFTKLGWILFAVCMMLVFATWLGWEHYLKTLGFTGT